MIAIDDALDALPGYDKFCSVAELQAFAEALRKDPRFTVEVAGTSAGGRPIDHIRFGQGEVKALFVSLLHCCEPIGGLTVHALMSLLKEGHPAVTGADVEWHIIPCADPDGALLNEGWSQQPITFERYMKGLYNQEAADQIDGSFPIDHKKLHFDAPTREAAVLKGVIDRIRPDFYFPLHNALIGGAFFLVAHDIGADRYRAFHALLEANGIPLQNQMYHAAFFDRLGDGVLKLGGTGKFYEMIEASGGAPEEMLKGGTTSFEYLTAIKPEAQTVVVELPYLSHPLSESDVPTGQNLRQIKLRIEAEQKYVAAATLEEWDKVKDDLDPASPFYRKVLGSIIDHRDRLNDGLPAWGAGTRDTLYNPAYNKIATERERFENHMISYWVLSQAYTIVRLLKASRQTDAVKAAIVRLEAVFDDALANILVHLDVDRLLFIGHRELAKAQLGCGFVTLNAMLAGRAA